MLFNCLAVADLFSSSDKSLFSKGAEEQNDNRHANSTTKCANDRRQVDILQSLLNYLLLSTKL